MNAQDSFGILAMFYAVANLGSMGIELELRETTKSLGVCSRNGGALFVAITAFPVIDPKLMVMILMAVPVPIIVWYFLAKFFVSQAGKANIGGAA